MRTFWITISILIAAGLAALFLIPAPEVAPTLESGIARSAATTVATITPPPAAPKTPLAAEPSAASPTLGTFTKGLDQTIKDAKVRPGKLVEKDGEILADGKFVIQGKGTKESPYEVSWEFLFRPGGGCMCLRRS